MLTFSKSINPSTITTNTLALFNGDTAIGYNYTISRDNRTIVVNYSGRQRWASGATITIELTQRHSGSVGQCSGEHQQPVHLDYGALELRTASGCDASRQWCDQCFRYLGDDSVCQRRDECLSTITGALNVTDNGVVVSGTVQLFSNAQAILFTPAAPFNAGDLIQVFLSSAALSSDSVPLTNFSGQFTIAGSLRHRRHCAGGQSRCRTALLRPHPR